MLYIAVFVSLLSVTSACSCTPTQWEGKGAFTLGAVYAGTPTVIKGVANISYDGTNMKIAAEEDIASGSGIEHIKIIQDYNKKKQYMITTMAGTQKCTVGATGPWTGPCMPGNATKIGDSYYGAGDNILNTTSYKFSFDQVDDYLIVTKKECILVAESFVGSWKNTPFMLGINFQGVTTGISNSSVFNVPTICDQGYTYQNIFSTHRSLPSASIGLLASRKTKI